MFSVRQMPTEVGTLRAPLGQTVEWEIENYFERSDEELNSPKFIFSDATWYLRIRPNGSLRSGTTGWTCLYLRKDYSLTESHAVNFKIGIKKADGSVYFTFDEAYIFDRNNSGWGSHNSLKPTEMSNLKDTLAPDNVLRIFCILRLLDDTAVETASQTPRSECAHLETLSQDLRKLCLGGYHSDVIIIVKDQEFQAHKSMLSARSVVFSTMFSHDTAENRNGLIEITDCDPDCFRNFLLYLYTGQVDIATCSEACGLFKIADKYNVQQLKADCVDCMTHGISIDSFCDVTRIAVMHNEADLLKTATEFFTQNSIAIFPSVKWQLFLRDHPVIANELLIKLSSRR